MIIIFTHVRGRCTASLRSLDSLSTEEGESQSKKKALELLRRGKKRVIKVFCGILRREIAHSSLCHSNSVFCLSIHSLIHWSPRPHQTTKTHVCKRIEKKGKKQRGEASHPPTEVVFPFSPLLRATPPILSLSPLLCCCWLCQISVAISNVGPFILFLVSQCNFCAVSRLLFATPSPSHHTHSTRQRWKEEKK